MGRSPCCSKVGLNRGAWTASEDKILTNYVKIHGEGKWRNLPKKAGLKRCGKSCRLRWLNYLRPDIKRGNISHDEEDLIIRLHNLLGNRWSLIAGRLPGRTDNEIKNYWNTTLGKKVHDPGLSQKPYKKKKTNRETDSTQAYDVNVVRTKALKCSKTIFSPHPEIIEPIINKSRLGKSDNIIGDGKNSANSSKSTGLDLSILPFHYEDENSSDFMLGVHDMGESSSFSNLFSSDFNDLLDFNDRILNRDNVSPSSSLDGPQFLTNEMLDYFSSVPELGVEWLP